MSEYHPAVMPTGTWGAEVDHNFFVTTESERRHFAVAGCDEHSICGQPRFLNAPLGDFRIADDSPARQVGFTGWTFPPTEYGVQSPKLRTIARTPVIPDKLRDPSREPPRADKPLLYHWADCAIRDFAGEEYSAYGTSRATPGLLVTQAGKHQKQLLANDVILELNGVPLASVADFVRLLKAAQTSTPSTTELRLVILRNQQKLTITLPSSTTLPML
jgi:hypothetical protein